jgi:uncharacterized delta-60 repeat protein
MTVARSPFLLGVTLLTALALAGPAQAAGELDSTFGGDGRVSTNFGGSESASDVAVQPDGKVVVVGGTSDGLTASFAVARYLPNGDPDPSFGGGDGRVTTDFEGGAAAVALQKDGKIVVAGSNCCGSIAIARYLTSGNLDPSFGDGGKVATGGTFQGVGDIALQSDGKIVVVGSEQVSLSSFDIYVTRYLPSGSPDPTFGALIDVSRGDEASAVAITPDGRFVLAGTSLLRLRANGTLDPSFGSGDGEVPGNFSDVVLQTDGKIVAAGAVGDGDQDFGVFRFLSNGNPDPAFSGDGLATADFGGGDAPSAVAIQAGKIVAAGSSWSGNNSNFAIARFRADGSVDQTFSGDGKTTTDFGGVDSASALALQADSKIVAAGTTSLGSGDFAVARYVGAVPTCLGQQATIADAGTIVGTPGNDVIVGSDGADQIDGGGGNDIICSLGGNDSVHGGEGADGISGADGNDTIHGDAGNDILRGGEGADGILGDAGNDASYGEAGNDIVHGGDGADFSFGDDGNDTVYGEKGNDVLRGGNGADFIFGDDGNDSVYGEAGNDALRGGNGADGLVGGDGNDSLYGEAGDDSLNGGSGADALLGGDGNDSLDGGANGDTCVQNAGTGTTQNCEQ